MKNKWVALSLVMLFGLLFGVWGYTNALGEQITLCVKKSGFVYVIGQDFKQEECETDDFLLSWGAPGPQGPEGEIGLQGPMGPPGLPATTSPVGPSWAVPGSVGPYWGVPQRGILDGSGELEKDTIAEEIGLNQEAFTTCLWGGGAESRIKIKVEEDYQSGIRAGAQGTPQSFVISTKTKKTYVIGGAVPISAIKNRLESALLETGDTEIASETSFTLDPVTPADHILGNPNAEVFIVEYSDLECPFCKQFHKSMLEIMSEYGAEGKVAWVYRHFPLDQLHSKARKEAEATECATELGGNDAFWEYTNKIFEITPSNNGLNLELL